MGRGAGKHAIAPWQQALQRCAHGDFSRAALGSATHMRMRWVRCTCSATASFSGKAMVVCVFLSCGQCYARDAAQVSQGGREAERKLLWQGRTPSMNLGTDCEWSEGCMDSVVFIQGCVASPLLSGPPSLCTVEGRYQSLP